ncbi:hypothetical protein [Fulvivirga lutea]|uniref:Uncharacterized protein n=1 Tax=Fulvivirga lutea TaxID=2810512 RepID=A0A974WH80_9BACT|nr:hypothetical protein [Fulvivirga lutea]QSE97658.1 hypothetical protein JR347_00805 [Fulvivirga lutea]
MDIKKELLKEHSKEQAEYIAAFIGTDKNRFKDLMSLFLGDDYRTSQRAAWAVSKCHDKNPELIAPYLKHMLQNLEKAHHDAVKRNTLRILQDIEIPESLWGKTADVCFKVMQSSAEPIAVKVFGMTVLANICQKVPELKNELRLIIEDQLPYGSAGFKSRAKKVLKDL